MFGPFKWEPFRDGQLGEFRRSGGYWKGSLVVAPCGTFRLALGGSREAPDLIALGLAKELPDRFKSLMPRIQTGLFEHYAPYKEAIDAGEETGSPCPSVASPEVRLAFKDLLNLVIEDDGRGFDFSGRLCHAELDAARKGPVVIRKRIRSIGGELTLESFPGRGARLQILWVPKPQDNRIT